MLPFLRLNSANHTNVNWNQRNWNSSYNGIHNAYGDSVKEIYEIIKKEEYSSGNGKLINEDITDAYISLIVDKLDLGISSIGWAVINDENKRRRVY